MQVIRFDLTTFEDLHTYGLTNILNELFNFMQTEIVKGKVIVIERRYSRLLEENQPLPDLIMVDGGKGQLSSAVEVMDNLGFKDYNIIGLAKRLEEVFLPGKSDPELIPKTSSGLKLLQQIRDEAHRFAITFHRERRSKRIIKTELTDIKGIGTETAKLLLEKFGSLDGIRNSSIEELENTVGKKKTQLLIEYFKTKIIAIN